MRGEAHALPGRAIVAQRDFILGAAIEEIEDRTRQAAARALAKIGDIHRP